MTKFRVLNLADTRKDAFRQAASIAMHVMALLKTNDRVEIVFEVKGMDEAKELRGKNFNVVFIDEDVP